MVDNIPMSPSYCRCLGLLIGSIASTPLEPPYLWPPCIQAPSWRHGLTSLTLHQQFCENTKLYSYNATDSSTMVSPQPHDRQSSGDAKAKAGEKKFQIQKSIRCHVSRWNVKRRFSFKPRAFWPFPRSTCKVRRHCVWRQCCQSKSLPRELLSLRRQNTIRNRTFIGTATSQHGHNAELAVFHLFVWTDSLHVPLSFHCVELNTLVHVQTTKQRKFRDAVGYRKLHHGSRTAHAPSVLGTFTRMPCRVRRVQSGFILKSV